MNKKATKFRETRGNGHPSQNDLPSIDKFHPDYWYYREEMDEPDDIDINYENESKNMNKKVIRLTESELRRMISETVRSVLREERDIDDDNYFGGGLPTNYFEDDDFPYGENDLELLDGTKVSDLQYGDMLQNYNTKDYAIVVRVLDDCISTVGGAIPKKWAAQHWYFVQHDVL